MKKPKILMIAGLGVVVILALFFAIRYVHAGGDKQLCEDQHSPQLPQYLRNDVDAAAVKVVWSEYIRRWRLDMEQLRLPPQVPKLFLFVRPMGPTGAVACHKIIKSGAVTDPEDLSAFVKSIQVAGGEHKDALLFELLDAPPLVRLARELQQDLAQAKAGNDPRFAKLATELQQNPKCGAVDVAGECAALAQPADVSILEKVSRLMENTSDPVVRARCKYVLQEHARYTRKR